MTRKYDVGKTMTLAEAIILHKDNLAIIVTDGKFVQIDSDSEE